MRVGMRELGLERRGIGGHGGQVCGVEMAIDPFFGSVLAAAANIGGGLIGGGSSSAANKRVEEQAEANRQAQLTAMQHGITWRAQDVMNAYKSTGIHPLALLGVQGPTYSPVSSAFAPSPVGESIGRAGQDIARGMHATADRDLRGAALELQRKALNDAAERGGLENDLLRVRIASEQARLVQANNPPVPDSGVNFPGVENRINPDVSLSRTPRGGYVVIPGKAVQERMEEMFGLGPEWFARNRAWLATPEARSWVQKFLPKPPSYHEWRYNVPTGEWLPSPVDYEDRHLPNAERARGVRRMIDAESAPFMR